jgi:hypothetical protein
MNDKNSIQTDHAQKNETDNATSPTSITKIDANFKPNHQRPRKVYLHSIGRFKNLKKLQAGTLGYY